MSRRKHVTQQSLTQDVQPPGAGQSVVRALGARGGNIVEVEYADGRSTLVLMPARFNKKLWVRRGGYVIIDESEEAQQDAGSRVTGTIVSVLYDEHVRQLRRTPGAWPPEFSDEAGSATLQQPGEEGGRSDGDDASSSGAEPAEGGGAGAGAAAAGGESRVEVASDSGSGDGDDDGSSEDSLEPLHQNSNRRVIYYEVSESDEDDEDEEDEEEEDEEEEEAPSGVRLDALGQAGAAGQQQQQQQQQQRQQQQRPLGALSEQEVDSLLDELGQKLTACELGKRAPT